MDGTRCCFLLAVSEGFAIWGGGDLNLFVTQKDSSTGPSVNFTMRRGTAAHSVR